MKIILTHTFKSDYKNFFGKHYKTCSIIKFCSFLHAQNIKKGFYLQRPFMKLKMQFGGKNIRIILVYRKQNDLVIPVFITDKNDKKYGENMIWIHVHSKIDTLMSKIDKDIQQNNFEVF